MELCPLPGSPALDRRAELTREADAAGRATNGVAALPVAVHRRRRGAIDPPRDESPRHETRRGQTGRAVRGEDPRLNEPRDARMKGGLIQAPLGIRGQQVEVQAMGGPT